MTTLEEELLRQLAPKGPLSLEVLQEDLLQPISEVTDNLNSIRNIVLQRLSLAVNLTEMLARQDTNVQAITTLCDTLQPLAEQVAQDTSPLLQRLADVTDQLTALQDAITTLTLPILQNMDLQRDVLLQLQAKLSR